MKKIAISAMLLCGLCFGQQAMAQCAKQDIKADKAQTEQCCDNKAAKQEAKDCCNGKAECANGKVDGVTSSTAVNKSKQEAQADCKCKDNKQCCKKSTSTTKQCCCKKAKKAEKKAKKAAAKAAKTSKKVNVN